MDTNELFLLEHILTSPFSAKEIERKGRLGNGTVNNIKRGTVPNVVVTKKIMDVLERPLAAVFYHPSDWKNRDLSEQEQTENRITELEKELDQIQSHLRESFIKKTQGL